MYLITIKTEAELLADGWEKIPMMANTQYYIKEAKGTDGNPYESCQITPLMSELLGQTLSAKFDSIGQLSNKIWYQDISHNYFFWREDMLSKVVKVD